MINLKKNEITLERKEHMREMVYNLPGTIGPTCLETIIGPRAPSLRIGSQDTDIKESMSSTESMYDEVVALLTSLSHPSELVCKIHQDN